MEKLFTLRKLQAKSFGLTISAKKIDILIIEPIQHFGGSANMSRNEEELECPRR